MIRNHIAVVMAFALLALNIMAALMSLGTGNMVVFALNLFCIGLMVWMLVCEWQKCQKARKRQTLLG
jgi:hypothetical protein